MKTKTFVGLLLALSLLLAGCAHQNSSSEPSATTEPAQATATEQQAEQTTAASEPGAAAVNLSYNILNEMEKRSFRVSRAATDTDKP